MKIMRILSYFSQEARDRREYREDNRRLEMLKRMADKAVNVTYNGNAIWITVEGVPTFRVTNESDLKARTIAIDQVELFVKELREDYVSTHKNDRLEARV